jgi:hypothetical protein
LCHNYPRLIRTATLDTSRKAISVQQTGNQFTSATVDAITRLRCLHHPTACPVFLKGLSGRQTIHRREKIQPKTRSMLW